MTKHKKKASKRKKKASVAEFYAPIMQNHSKEAQELTIRLLKDEFKQANELVDAITVAAEGHSAQEGAS